MPDEHKAASVSIRPLMSLLEVSATINISRRCLERLIASGAFPGPDKRIGRISRWRPETVEAWIGGKARN